MTDTVPTQIVRVGAFGHVVDIEVADDAASTRIREQWSLLLAPDASGTAAGGGADTFSYPSETPRDLAEYTVTSGVTLRFIEARAGELTMLHAAGIADLDTGAVTALVAGSGTGKTTAAARLCRGSFGYVTDETVAVCADRTVLPYPKPLSIITDGEVYKQQHGPAELGLLPAPADLSLSLSRIVVLERGRGLEGDESDTADAVDGSPSVAQVPLLDGILTLIPQISYLARMTEPLLSIVRLVQACGGIHRLSYDEIEHCEGPLRRLAAASPSEDADVEHLGSLSDPLPEPAVTGTFRRGAFLDGVRIDNELLLLVGDYPVRCSGLGATMWLSLDSPRTEAELLAICVELHGPHPDAATLVRAAIDQLSEHQVLRAD